MGGVELMKHKCRRRLICLVALLLMSSSLGHCAEQDPVKFLTDFYTWYISSNRQMNLLYHGNIYLYVARETVEEIKKRPANSGNDGTDYFIKLDDTPSDMSRTTIHVNNVERQGVDTVVAIVSIGRMLQDKTRLPDSVVVVVMKDAKGGLRITKCLDIYPEA